MLKAIVCKNNSAVLTLINHDGIAISVSGLGKIRIESAYGRTLVGSCNVPINVNNPFEDSFHNFTLFTEPYRRAFRCVLFLF